MEEEKIKQIIIDSINTGICIDDKFVEPYMKPEGYDEETPQKLYNSFKSEAGCLLDIYRFDNYKKFSSDKAKLLDNKDVVILDWELNDKSSIKFGDALKIMGDCVEENNIKIICVYTAESDLNPIIFDILGYHSKLRKNKDRYDQLKEIVDDVLINDSLLNIDDLEQSFIPMVKNFLLMNKFQQKEECKKLIENITNKTNKKVTSSICKSLKKFKEDNKFIDNVSLFKWLCYYENVEDPIDKNGKYDIKIVSKTSLMLDSTLVLLLSKSSVVGTGISPDQLLGKIVFSIKRLPNINTYLFTSLIRTPIYQGLATIGKGLMDIDENAIIQYTNNCERESLIQHISSLLGLEVKDILKNRLDINLISELFVSSTTNKNYNDEILRLNSLITFTPTSEMISKKKNYETGDVFEIYKPLSEVSSGFLLCVTQECDCKIPKKIYYNFAFTWGKLDEKGPKEILKETEKDLLTFLPDKRVIKWSDRFMTINMEGHTMFKLNEEIEIDVSKDKKYKMKYLGNLKDVFIHRIAINTFSHAMRIGIDLPHTDGDKMENEN